MQSALFILLSGIARRITAAIWRIKTSIRPPTSGFNSRASDMPIPSSMGDLSVTESSNSPNGSDAISTGLDNYLRAIQSILRSTNYKGPDIASGASVAIGASTGQFLSITGTTTITSFDSVSAGIIRTCIFTGALTITHSTNIQLPSSTNYQTQAGDSLTFLSLGSGQWKCIALSRPPLDEATASEAYLQDSSASVMTTRRMADVFFAATVAYDTTDPENPYWRFGVKTTSMSGWSISETSAGVFTITHNLDLSADLANLIVSPSSYGNTMKLTSWGPKGADSFYLYTQTSAGVPTSLACSFTAIRVGA